MSATTGDRASVIQAALERALHADEVIAREGAREVRVCAGGACHAAGRPAVAAAFRDQLAEQGLSDTVRVVETGCHGFCAQGPVVVVQPQGLFYSGVTAGDVAGIIAASVVADGVYDKCLYRDPASGDAIPYERDIAFYAGQRRLVLALHGKIDPRSIDDYLAQGGYAALARVLADDDPDGLIKTVTKSGLRSDGGAGSVTGAAWNLARRRPGDVKYVVCTADPGDPGAFVDRAVLDGNPHVVIEGMAIAAVASGATEGYVQVRRERPFAVERLAGALVQARERGLLGSGVLGTDFTFDIRLTEGAGAFVCDEATALAPSNEARPGIPFARPPYPSVGGRPDAPASIDNAETFASVPWIVLHGADEFAAVGLDKSRGTKIFSLSGKVVSGGLAEVPMGTTLRHVIYDVGGGMLPGHELKAVQIGGASGGCLPAAMLDTPLDHKLLVATGATASSGGLVALDDTTSMIDLARHLVQLTHDESCGKCVPCRLGVKRMLETLERICDGDGRQGDIALLEELAEYITAGALCAVGATAANPVLSTLEHFRDEYEALLADSRSPTEGAEELVIYYIDDNCTGCGLCAKKCPTQCISGEKKQQHVIDVAGCIRCGTCRQVCKFDAVKTKSGAEQGERAAAGGAAAPTDAQTAEPAAPTEAQAAPAADPQGTPRVTLTIDGRQTACEPGETILEAAQRLDIRIPTLCNEPRLPGVAACRVCMVEVKGARKPVPSCSTVATEGMVVRTDTEKVLKMRHLYLELLLSDHDSFCTPPCRTGCPSHIKIPQFLDAIAHGDYRAGVRKLREDLPFPAILGRVCPHPCEGPCRRSLVEQSITICWLHRFMADQCLDEEQTGELLLPYEPRPDSGKTIAIVGAGPAGLTCAFYARLEGHAVKIFEALPKPGGMLRYGIPSYRLPRDVIDKELNVLWRLGVELECGTRLGADFQLDDLTARYDAVFLGLGALGSNAMGIDGDDAEGVVAAVDFLGELELTGDVRVGDKVAVVGGGFTAMAACRTAIRKGAGAVTCLYRGARDEMTAPATEVDEAVEEGVQLELLAAPLRILVDGEHKVTGIEVQRIELGEPDASGRQRLAPVEGSEFVVACDQVIAAVGQFPILDGAGAAQGVKRTEWQTVEVDDVTFQTDDPRVFAGGDAVLGGQTVIQSVAQGKRAAWSIDAFLRGCDMPRVSRQLTELRATPFMAALDAQKELDPRIARMAEITPVFLDMTTDVSHPAPPPAMPRLAPGERATNFAQIEQGLPEAAARRGAALCLDCYCPANGACDLQCYGIEYGVSKNRFHGQAVHDYPADFRHDFIMREPNRCINCLRCVRVCRTEVGASCYDVMGRGWDTIVSTPDNLPLQTVGCVSCGKCAETCPTGAIMTNPRVLRSYDLDESRCIFCGECVEVCPYDALEQTDFFELAGYSRTQLAGESLFVRGGKPVDVLRETVADLVPHVRDAIEGDGWQWAPVNGDGAGLDEIERDG